MMIDQTAVLEMLDCHMGGVFRWGTEDCLIGSANVFRDLHGPDVAEMVRDCYASEADALAILEYGFRSSLLEYLEETAMAHGLYRLTDVNSAPLGAIGVTEAGHTGTLDGRATCIHFGNGMWATKAIRGYALAAKAEVCWYV